ncbi:MAG: hypothetical protein ACLQL2_11925 [Methylovirgula sp.]
MAVRAFCDDPSSLLRDIRKGIESGLIQTWSIDAEGDLTHTPDQWRGKAWMRPRLQEDRIVFNILGNKNAIMKRSTYAVYHGRLIEMLLRHFDDQLIRISATANGVQGDIFSRRPASESDS